MRREDGEINLEHHQHM